MTKAQKQTKRNECIERLREWLKDGDTLFFILRHRSASGMQRIYSVKHFTTAAIVDHKRLGVTDLSSNIGDAFGYGWSESHWGVKVNGCGFSAEHEITDCVERALGIKLHYETL